MPELFSVEWYKQNWDERGRALAALLRHLGVEHITVGDEQNGFYEVYMTEDSGSDAEALRVDAQGRRLR